MAQTKIRFIATADVYVADARGNVKVLKPGTELTVKAYEALKPAQQAKFERVETLTKRAQAALDRQAAIEHRHYGPDELHLIEDPKAQADALKLQAVWSYVAPAGVPFCGVGSATDHLSKDRRTNWYVATTDWSADLPAMQCGDLRRQTRAAGEASWIKVQPGGYKHAAVTVRTALNHAKAGRDLFVAA